MRLRASTPTTRCALPLSVIVESRTLARPLNSSCQYEYESTTTPSCPGMSASTANPWPAAKGAAIIENSFGDTRKPFASSLPEVRHNDVRHSVLVSTSAIERARDRSARNAAGDALLQLGHCCECCTIQSRSACGNIGNGRLKIGSA